MTDKMYSLFSTMTVNQMDDLAGSNFVHVNIYSHVIYNCPYLTFTLNNTADLLLWDY